MSKPYSIVRIVSFAVIIFIAAAGGMYLGARFKGKSDPLPEVSADVFQEIKLQPGTAFPEVTLLDRAYKPVPFDNVLSSEGTVVLFMDPKCPPCGEMAEYWQSLISKGELGQNQVVGICFFNASQIEEIYLNYGIGFPVYADEGYVFYDNYGIDAFPLTVVVSKSGTIAYSEPDSNIKLKSSKLRELFASH